MSRTITQEMAQESLLALLDVLTPQEARRINRATESLNGTSARMLLTQALEKTNAAAVAERQRRNSSTSAVSRSSTKGKEHATETVEDVHSPKVITAGAGGAQVATAAQQTATNRHGVPVC